MSAFFESVRLILLADEPEWAMLLGECLGAQGSSCSLICAPSWEAANALLSDGVQAVLLSTPALLPEAGSCSLPSIVLLEHAPDALPIGVSDWLVRSTLNAEVLRRCLRYVIERERLKASLGGLAVQDSLTGITNRQGFQALLCARLAEFKGQGLVLGHLDLDNFRHANDALGHKAGDRLIVQVVARLKSQLEPGDLLARLGSDEFALLLDIRRDPQRLERLAERVTEVLAEPYWIDGESLLIGCSLGLVVSNGDQRIDPLMWFAHIAMQQAKMEQGCSFHIYDEQLDRGGRGQAELECELRGALRRDELELHYQPRLALDGNRIVGVEALVRWRHTERGLLAPDAFVPLAEDSGLIVPLGYWVISRALRDMQWLLEQGLPPLHMAINLSFRQFQDSQLLPTLTRLIEERGVDAQWLEFELTETAVMRRSDQVSQTMGELSALGVRFSLDDFGTGFSSFVHLSKLPIALLKVDRSFVGSMLERTEHQRLVRAMVTLAHNLDLQAVAEGVETPEQLALLRSFGCDQAQGYLISKGLPIAELAGFLASWGGAQLSAIG